MHSVPMEEGEGKTQSFMLMYVYRAGVRNVSVYTECGESNTPTFHTGTVIWVTSWFGIPGKMGRRDPVY